MAIDAMVSGASANSYVTIEEADTYFADHLDAGAWDEAGAVSPPRQEAALIQAAIRMDQESYRWRRADTDQALAWPRYGQEDVDGNVIDADVMPTFVKRAQMELALDLLAEDEPFVETGLEDFKRLKVDVIEIEMRGGQAGSIPSHVRRFLAHALRTSLVQFPILRGS